MFYGPISQLNAVQECSQQFQQQIQKLEATLATCNQEKVRKIDLDSFFNFFTIVELTPKLLDPTQ